MKGGAEEGLPPRRRRHPAVKFNEGMEKGRGEDYEQAGGMTLSTFIKKITSRDKLVY